MDKLIQKIKEFRSVSPDSDFLRRSMDLISLAPQTSQNLAAHFWESFRTSIALSLGSLVILVTLGGFSYLNLNKLSPFIVGGLNTKGLVAEAEQASSGFQIAEAKYFEDTSVAVATALGAVSESGPDHLNSDILDRELRSLDNQNNSLDNLYNL